MKAWATLLDKNLLKTINKKDRKSITTICHQDIENNNEQTKCLDIELCSVTCKLCLHPSGLTRSRSVNETRSNSSKMQIYQLNENHMENVKWEPCKIKLNNSSLTDSCSDIQRQYNGPITNSSPICFLHALCQIPLQYFWSHLFALVNTHPPPNPFPFYMFFAKSPSNIFKIISTHSPPSA